MPKIIAFVLGLVLLAAGLVFATSLAIVAAVLLGAWQLRNVWARVTGRPVRTYFPQRRRAGDVEDAGPMGSPSRVPGLYLGTLRRSGAAEVTDVRPK